MNVERKRCGCSCVDENVKTLNHTNLLFQYVRAFAFNSDHDWRFPFYLLYLMTFSPKLLAETEGFQVFKLLTTVKTTTHHKYYHLIVTIGGRDPVIFTNQLYPVVPLVIAHGINSSHIRIFLFRVMLAPNIRTKDIRTQGYAKWISRDSD